VHHLTNQVVAMLADLSGTSRKTVCTKGFLGGNEGEEETTHNVAKQSPPYSMRVCGDHGCLT